MARGQTHRRRPRLDRHRRGPQLLLTWWAGPLDHIAGNRFAALTFATRDIVPLGYAAFAFALGTTAGLLLRRTMPAMAVTLAVFIGMQILMPTLIRPHLLPSTTVTFPDRPGHRQQAHGIYTAAAVTRCTSTACPYRRVRG